MALFSRKKNPPVEPVNPWILAGQSVSAPEVSPSRKVGRPTAANPRTRRVSMSLTEEEHAAWTVAAEGRGLSAWARDQVTAQLESGRPGDDGKEVARLRADLGRMGSNLNQLTRAVNSGQVLAHRELLEAVEATRQELARLRGELA